MIEWVLATRVLVSRVKRIQQPLWIETPCCSAVMRLNSLGNDGGPCLPISVTAVWVFHPSGAITHSSAAHWHHLDLLVIGMFVSFWDWWVPHYHTTEGTVLCLLHSCLITFTVCNLDKRMQKQRKAFIHVHYMCPCFTFLLSLSLSVSRACLVASWWVQLEFHSQLSSSSNGNWHIPVNPSTQLQLLVFTP